MRKLFKNFELVKNIKASEGLSPQKKSAVLRKLKRIYDSKEERKSCDFHDSCRIVCAFHWAKTKDGHDYWAKLATII